MKKRTFLSLKDALSVVKAGSDIHALRQFNFMNNEQPASVGGLLSSLGFGSRFEQLPNADSGRLEPDSWSDKGYEVVINKGHSRLRQRFSALHEVGHYYLHTNSADVFAPERHRATGYTLDHVYDAVGRVEESEANQWADAVIFGDHAIEGALGLWGRDVHLLSRHFGFSHEVIERALNRRSL